MREIQHADSGPAGQECPEDEAAPVERPRRSRALEAGVFTAVVLCLATTLVHVVLVFLHVAPPNTVSKRYSPQINAWVYPLFEQNWRLFAPDPDSVNRQVLARTAHTRPDGSTRVSGWFDLSAADTAAVEHNPFPSHTTQNLLRRAWTSYTDSHGGDDASRTERAVMMRKYLSNIAADRLAARTDGTFDFVQLRVVTLPVAAPGSAVGKRPPAPVENRLLPWWKVPVHGK
ncbi:MULTISPECIES: DUF5819 family protein [Streptomyces]|uniref:DUF5819 family protein n=1 Tax=Streptomyces achmelvichensis TaxID=3134111 RepID=A0ACC6PYV5_9ACTN|nr:DUF5819 family protein [Streptomyces sp. NBC_01167]